MFVIKVIGIKWLYYVIWYLFKGLKVVFLSEFVVCQELVLLVIGVVLSFWLDVMMVEQVLMVSSLLLIIIVELFNSVIEVVVDRIGLEIYEFSGKVKDIGLVVVFMVILLVLFCWVFILYLLIFDFF